MASISLEEAQNKLPDLIHRLGPGEELVITENDQPIARLVGAADLEPTRVLGTLRGSVVRMAADFDAPLDLFEHGAS